MLLKPFENLLPDTKSAKNRGYRYTPADATSGVLVYQSKAKRDRAAYAVTEFPADLSGRAFRCQKLADAPDAECESYDVLVSDRPQADLCDCRGFVSTGHCKHLDCLRDLLAHGQLMPLSNPDADCGCEEFDDIYAEFDPEPAPTTPAADEWEWDHERDDWSDPDPAPGEITDPLIHGEVY
jgi:hypothetical protein